ncbi:MAG TPA: hypothetical protein VFQ18_00040 [Candidatus Acidoferrum sp.]|jgi:hypothetical protein|nr:hypothetical protein [Candidatus Acidoferrum sp.]
MRLKSCNVKGLRGISEEECSGRRINPGDGFLLSREELPADPFLRVANLLKTQGKKKSLA